MQMRTSARWLATVAGAAALVASGSSPVHAMVPTTRLASTPVIKVAFAHHVMSVSGPKTFKAGRVTLQVKGHGVAEVAQLRRGYTFAMLTQDLGTFGASQDPSSGVSQSQGLAALDHAVKHFIAYGGVGGGTTASLYLPKAGKYFVVDDTGNVPVSPHKLVVKGPAVKRATPRSNGTIIAKQSDRWGGASTLKPSGWLTFRNASNYTPHFLSLMPVKNGTTRGQVIKFLESSGPQSGPPSFVRKGRGLDTDLISQGRTMMVKYALSKGAYAEMCFFPDPKTGMPHAFMGMVRIIHMK